MGHVWPEWVSWVGVPSRREQAVLWGKQLLPTWSLEVLPRPRYPCPGQFPSIGLWVWNKLALMAPALILCGRIPRDSRAITGGAAMPSAASSPPAAAPMEEMGGRGKVAPARQQCLHPSWQRPEQGGPWSHVRPCSTASPG